VKEPKKTFSVGITIDYKGIQIQDFLIEVILKTLRLFNSLLLSNVSNRLKPQESKATPLDFLDFLSLLKVYYGQRTASRN
jgi:hypothetical protein